MSGRTLFVTGTDTGAGKTTVACALLRLGRAQGLRVCGWKPVATGSERGPAGLRNDDALALERAAQAGLAYEQLNPYAFEPPVAPHLAARAAGVAIDLERLERVHTELARRHDLVIAEGAGGWRVPLTDDATFGSWVAARRWPVLLVVGLRLGCLNHALLSAEAIMRETTLAGWIANELPEGMALLEENLATLHSRMPSAYWGRLRAGATVLDDSAVASAALAGYSSGPSSSRT